MNIAIHTTHKMELTDAIRSYIEKRIKGLEKIITSLHESPTIYVEVGKTTNHHKSGDIFKAEVRVSIKGATLYAVAKESDLYAAIDKVKDEIECEAKKIKDKKQTLRRRGGATAKSLIKRSFKK